MGEIWCEQFNCFANDVKEIVDEEVLESWCGQDCIDCPLSAARKVEEEE